MRIPTTKPSFFGYLGPRTLLAFLAVLALGIILYLIGVMTAAATERGIGALFLFIGLVGSVAVLLRWLIYRQIG